MFDGEIKTMLSHALEQMFYCKELKVGKAVIPGDTVRSRLYELTYDMLRDVVDKLHRNTREIKNRTGYIMSVIYNSLTEDINLLHTDPFLNSMRGDEKCT